MERIKEYLEDRERLGILRELNPASFRRKARICLDGKEYVDLSSNDYLGLSCHPVLIEAAKRSIDSFGVSCAASRLMSGDLQLHHQLECKIARFKAKEAAVIFNSGYQANAGIISALCAKEDCVFFDKLSHASLIDGVLLSGARFFRFKHNDTAHLEELLEKERKKSKNCLIITESIFSMDGDKAPLKELVGLKEKYDCDIFIDEAHATGIFGKNGSGLAEESGLTKKIDFIMGTFGKALGGFGAYLACSDIMARYMINACRTFIYSTALPPSVIAADLAAIDIIGAEPFRREKLLSMADFFRGSLKEKGMKVTGDSQIIPVIIGDNQKSVDMAEKLRQKGWWVMPVRPPTVPRGQARLRFSLSFDHCIDELGRLADDVAQAEL